jgi:hypothetical protein
VAEKVVIRGVEVVHLPFSSINRRTTGQRTASMSPRDSSDDEDGNLSSSTSSSGDSSSSSTSGREEIPFQPPQQLLDQYQALLSQTIDIPNLILAGLLPTQPLGDDDEMDGGKMMTKAEKQNAKKKRRKEREREAKSALQGISGVGDGQVEAEKATSMSTISCKGQS